MARLSHDYVVSSLVQRGVPEHVAQGVAMNFQDESGLDTGIQEKAPLAGRGGFGLAQWTGPRRIALEDFARSQGKRIDDPELQLDYFMHENQNYEAPAWKTVMNAPTAQDAAVAFVKHWERPTSENVAKRTAKYTGEGAAHFGGTGLGQPASDTRTGDWPTRPLPPTDSPADTQEASGVDDTIDSLGTALTGAAGGRSSVPNVPLAKPTATLVQSQPGELLNPQAMQASRDRLAMAMARLNSGKLWVG
jgi:hypothetical protein